MEHEHDQPSQDESFKKSRTLAAELAGLAAPESNEQRPEFDSGRYTRLLNESAFGWVDSIKEDGVDVRPTDAFNQDRLRAAASPELLDRYGVSVLEAVLACDDTFEALDWLKLNDLLLATDIRETDDPSHHRLGVAMAQEMARPHPSDDIGYRHEIMIGVVGKFPECRENQAVRETVAAATVWRNAPEGAYVIDPADMALTDDEMARAAEQEIQVSLTQHDLDPALNAYRLYQPGDSIKVEISNYLSLVESPINEARFGTGSLNLDHHFPEFAARMAAEASKMIITDREGFGLMLIDHAAGLGAQSWYGEMLVEAADDDVVFERFNDAKFELEHTLPGFDYIKGQIMPEINDDDEPGLRPPLSPEDDPDRFDPAMARLAGQINRLQWGKLSAEEVAAAGFDPATQKLIAGLPQFVEGQIQAMVNLMRKRTNIPGRDIEAVAHGDQAIRPGGVPALNKTAEAMVARFIATSSGGDITTLNGMASSGELTRELNEAVSLGFRSYIDSYDEHIPYYDKVYESFDEVRELGRPEMYLGRDGVYAYEGRRAQAAVRHKADTQSKPDPRYLVYNRRIKDRVDVAIKAEYLRQNGLVAGGDANFFDTGYEGTIPEDILGIMGYSKEQIDNRIFMLSANSEARRVPSLNDNATSIAIELIEDGPKQTKTALGLTRSKEGTLEPVAPATSAGEQLRFAMVRRAIMRHYFLKESDRLKAQPGHDA